MTVVTMPRALALLVRAIHLCREYHAGWTKTTNWGYAWGLAEAQYEISLLSDEVTW